MRHRRTGDPTELIDLAAASLRLVGGILVLLATLGMLVLFVRLRVDRRFDGDDALLHVIVSTIPYLLGGGGFVLAARFVRGRRRWAAVVAMCLTSGACAISFALLLSLIVTAQRDAEMAALLAIPIFGVAAFLCALGILVVHLSHTFEAMRQLADVEKGPGRGGAGGVRGFEPLGLATPANVLPVAPLPVPPLPSQPGGSRADPAQG